MRELQHCAKGGREKIVQEMHEENTQIILRFFNCT